jgi:hypothetical protein
MRSSGQNQVTRVKRHESAHELNDLRNLVDHVSGVILLNLLAVDHQAQSQVVRVLNALQRDEIANRQEVVLSVVLELVPAPCSDPKGSPSS